MAAGFDHFGPFTEALGLAAKLTMEQRRLDEAQKRSDMAFQANRERLMSSAMEEQNKFAFESARDMFKKATEGYDPEDPNSAIMLKSAITNMEQFAGRPLVPRDGMGEPVIPGVKFKSANAAAEKVSPLGQLMKERDALPEGDPRRKAYDDVIARQGQPPSTTVNNQTTVTPLGNVPLGTGPRADATKTVIGKDEAIASMDRVLAKFNPDFLNVEKRMGASWDSWKTKSKTLQDIFGEVKPQDRKFMEDMNAWMADAFSIMNTHINQRTGATMGVQEAKRLTKEVPDPGDGVFSGDDPATFLKKAKAVRGKLSLDRARYMTYLNKGIGPEGPLTQEQVAAKAKSDALVPLPAFQKMIDDRGDQIAATYKSSNPKASETEINRYVESQLRNEFNLE